MSGYNNLIVPTQFAVTEQLLCEYFMKVQSFCPSYNHIVVNDDKRLLDGSHNIGCSFTVCWIPIETFFAIYHHHQNLVRGTKL